MFGRRPKIDTTFGVPMDLNQPFGTPFRDRNKTALETRQKTPEVHPERLKLPETAPKSWGAPQNHTDEPAVTDKKLPMIPIRILALGTIILWVYNPLFVIVPATIWLIYYIIKLNRTPDI